MGSNDLFDGVSSSSQPPLLVELRSRFTEDKLNILKNVSVSGSSCLSIPGQKSEF